MKETIETITQKFNAGFTCIAHQKAALSALNGIYDYQKRLLMDSILNARTDANQEQINDLYWSVPMDLHLWKPARSESLMGYNEEARNTMDDLKALRDAIKTSSIVPQTKSQSTIDIKVKAVEKAVQELVEQKNDLFEHGKRLVEIFGGLNVNVKPHFVTNQQGTTFIRCFYYLHGKLMPLQMIIAIAENISENPLQ